MRRLRLWWWDRRFGYGPDRLWPIKRFIGVKLRFYRLRRCSYTSVTIYRDGGQSRTGSHYWTPLGVWTHPWRMRAVSRYADHLLSESEE